MFKVSVLSKCLCCNGEAYQPIEELEDSQGRSYTRYAPCPTCEGSGNQPQWANLEDFAKLLYQTGCLHEHTSYQGNMRFIGGDVWDDLTGKPPNAPINNRMYAYPCKSDWIKSAF